MWRVYFFFETSSRECVFCKEYSDLLRDKLNDIRCISYEDEFKTLCLNHIVLETPTIQYRGYKNNFTDIKSFPISKVYFLAYLISTKYFLRHRIRKKTRSVAVKRTPYFNSMQKKNINFQRSIKTIIND